MMSKDQKPSAEILEYSNELAALLHETEPAPKNQIIRIVETCGIEFSRELYKATAEIEDQGGLMLPDNSRRRTRGGVFFYLVRTKVDAAQRQIIFPTLKGSKASNQIKPVSVPLVSWDERIPLIQSLQSEQGEIKSMKVILSGRPGRIEKRPEVVVTTMSDVASAPNLPRGIPIPSTTPTLYAVYMTPKQWEYVETSMADPSDNLMIDGVCAFDPDTNGMAVFALSVRSELMEAKARAEKKPNPPAAKAPKAAVPAKATAPASPQPQGKSGKKPQSVETKSSPAVTLNPKLPPDAARKLNELHASASLFRQKITNLQGKPAGQQFGLEMTQKLLKNVEDEIAALEKKYNA
jgi:hypothetical protein